MEYILYPFSQDCDNAKDNHIRRSAEPEDDSIFEQLPSLQELFKSQQHATHEDSIVLSSRRSGAVLGENSARIDKLSVNNNWSLSTVRSPASRTLRSLETVRFFINRNKLI